jgi:NADH-quinone oxidoreductase subunit M
MIPVLLILLPIVGAICIYLFKNQARNIAWAASILTLATALYALINFNSICNCNYKLNVPWLVNLGANFNVAIDGVSLVLCLLAAITLPVLFLGIVNRKYENEHSYYALLLLAVAGIIGVFVSRDALLFYFFWELALIPVYFLSSKWGGEKRIAASIKFFIYTFLGSLFMLIAIIFVQSKTANNSFSWEAMKAANLTSGEQAWTFAFMFLAFAIKMPIFPLHTWQPAAYTQAPTSTTIVLSALMVKMGVFGTIFWLLPMFPNASSSAAHMVIVFSIIGIVYASLIAIQQKNIKTLVAYSSIAHIGLMAATLFVKDYTGNQAVVMQMFHHGINILGLWLVVDIVERKTGIQNINELGGLAKKAPVLSICLLIIAFANIGLPLTNAFVGEFLMLKTLYSYNIWAAVFAGLAVILSAVYTLTMVQKVFFGEVNKNTENVTDIDVNEKGALIVLIMFILVMGVYSEPFKNLLQNVTYIK